MTNPSASAAAVAAAPLPLAPASAGHRRWPPPASPSPSRTRPAHRCRASCAPRWKRAFGASDADGAWDWKTAYDACEAATVLFLRKFGPAHARAEPASPAAHAADAGEDRRPSSHPHAPLRGERRRFQQFSTPIPLGFAAAAAAAITPADRRAGALGRHRAARHPRRARRRLARPERARRDPRRTARPSLSRHRRHPLRRRADRRSSRRRHRAERRADEPALLGVANVDRPHGRRRASPYRLGAWRGSPRAAVWSRSPARTSRPDNPAWRDAFVRLQERGRVVFTAAIDGAVYAKHGTTIETRLTVIDKRARRRSDGVSGLAGHGAGRRHAARLGHRARSAALAARRRPSPLPTARVRPSAHGRAPIATRAVLPSRRSRRTGGRRARL